MRRQMMARHDLLLTTTALYRGEVIPWYQRFPLGLPLWRAPVQIFAQHWADGKLSRAVAAVMS